MELIVMDPAPAFGKEDIYIYVHHQTCRRRRWVAVHRLTKDALEFNRIETNPFIQTIFMCYLSLSLPLCPTSSESKQ